MKFELLKKPFRLLKDLTWSHSVIYHNSLAINALITSSLAALDSGHTLDDLMIRPIIAARRGKFFLLFSHKHRMLSIRATPHLRLSCWLASQFEDLKST